MVCEPRRPPAPKLFVRKFRPDDPVPEITALLHRAYKPLADQGMRFLATYQDDATTLRRLTDGEGYVGLLDGRIVATITFLDAAHTSGCPWYDRPDVACFAQFAVEPGLQGRGLGSSMMDLAETRARETGARELALDTSEKAADLIRFYGKSGYRFIEHVQWDPAVVNYRSVILSKTLSAILAPHEHPQARNAP